MYIVQPGSASVNSKPNSTANGAVSPHTTRAARRRPGTAASTRTATSTAPSPAGALTGSGVLSPSPSIRTEAGAAAWV